MPVKIYAVNGSPRMNGNTAKLCRAFLNGAASAENVEIELIHLVQIDFKGCMSCYACKLDNDRFYGKCNFKDHLSPILEKLSDADGILFASPIYFGGVTSLMKAFMERLLFPFNSYEKGWRHIAPKRMPTAAIYDMNITEEYFEVSNYQPILHYFERCIERIFTKPEHMYVYDTCQFDNYSKYKAENFDEEHKRNHQKLVFPKDCDRAYRMGTHMAKRAMKGQS